jgi:hypothetical protein
MPTQPSSTQKTAVFATDVHVNVSTKIKGDQ